MTRFFIYILQTNETSEPSTSHVNNTSTAQELDTSTEPVPLDISGRDSATTDVEHINTTESNSHVSNTTEEPMSVNAVLSAELHIIEPPVSDENMEHVVGSAGDYSNSRPSEGAASSKPVPDITISEDNTENTELLNL